MNKVFIFFILITILCVNFIISFSTNDTAVTIPKTRLAVGIGFIPNININLGNYTPPNWNNICCNPLDMDYVDLGLDFEIKVSAIFKNLYNLPFFDSLSYNLSSNFSYVTRSISASNVEPSRLVFQNGEIKNLVEKNELILNYSSLYWMINFEIGSAFDSLNYFKNYFEPKFYFSLGPLFGFVINNSYSQILSIIEPKGFVYSNGQDFQKFTYSNFADLNKFIFGINLNFDLSQNANSYLNYHWAKNFVTGIGLRYIYFISNLLKNQKLNSHNLGLKLYFIYNPPLYYEE